LAKVGLAKMKKSIAFLVIFVGLVSLTTGQDCQGRILPDGLSCSTANPGVIHVVNNNNQTYPDSQQCSRYWQCEEGSRCEHLMQCEAGTFYDVWTGKCLPPSEAKCGNKKCPHQGYFPDEKNCMKYYYCDSSLEPHYHNCIDIRGRKFLFDADSNWCNWASLVDCKGRPICNKDDSDCIIQKPTTRATTEQPITTTIPSTTSPVTTTTKPHTTTTTEPVTTQTTTTSEQTTVRPSFGTCNEEFGLECQLGQYKAMERCSPFFCQCSAAGWVKKRCPDSLVFDQQIQVCQFPSSTSCN